MLRLELLPHIGISVVTTRHGECGNYASSAPYTEAAKPYAGAEIFSNHLLQKPVIPFGLHGTNAIDEPLACGWQKTPLAVANV